MTKVDLKIGERLALLNTLNVVKGDLQTINRVFKILDKINPTEEETKRLKITYSGTNVGWDVKKDKEVSLEFTEEECGIIQDELQKKTDYTAADRFLPTVAGKFAVKSDKEESKEEKQK